MTAHERQKAFNRIQENRLVSLIVIVGATLGLLGFGALLPASISECIFFHFDSIEDACVLIYLVYAFASAAAIWSAVTRNSARRRTLLICAWTITGILLMVEGNFFWLAKDGFGPLSGRSTGITAIGKFTREVWFPYGVIIILPTVCLLWSRRLRDEKNF